MNRIPLGIVITLFFPLCILSQEIESKEKEKASESIGVNDRYDSENAIELASKQVSVSLSDPTVVDLGPLMCGGKVKFCLEITNPFHCEFFIDDVKADCSCVVGLPADNIKVNPRESFPLKLIFSVPREAGPVSRTLKVLDTQNSREIVIGIESQVFDPIAVSPSVKLMLDENSPCNIEISPAKDGVVLKKVLPGSVFDIIETNPEKIILQLKENARTAARGSTLSFSVSFEHNSKTFTLSRSLILERPPSFSVKPSKISLEDFSDEDISIKFFVTLPSLGTTEKAVVTTLRSKTISKKIEAILKGTSDKFRVFSIQLNRSDLALASREGGELKVIMGNFEQVIQVEGDRE